MISSLLCHKKQACLKFVCAERASMSIINIKNSAPFTQCVFNRWFFGLCIAKNVFLGKDDPVESTWCWWLCSIYQCFQPGAGRHLGRPGQKTSVFTLWFALLGNRSPCPATPMLKQNSTSLSQDLGLINPNQGTRIKTNVLLGRYWCFRALILGFRTNWLGLRVCLASLDQLRQAYKL